MKTRTFVLPCVLSLRIGLAQTAPSTAGQLTPVFLPRQLTLPQAEELLLQRNLTVVASRNQLAVSQAMRQIAGYKPNPAIQVGAEQFPIYSPIHGSFPRFFSTNSETGAEPTWTAQFTKLFERGGKREFRMAQAGAQVEAAEAQILDTFRTQLFQLRQAFAAAMLARENLKLAQILDQQYQQIEQLTMVRVKFGDLAQMEQFRIKAGRLPFKQAVLDAQNAYEQAGRDILNLLNAQSEAVAAPARRTMVTAANSTSDSGSFQPAVEVIGDFEKHQVTGTLAELQKIALGTRPDVKAARSNLRAAEEGVLLAESQRTRDISVGVEYQRVGSDHALGVVAQMPLFLYNNQKAAIAQAIAQRHIAEAQLRQAEMQAATDVAKTYQTYRSVMQSAALYSDDTLGQVEKLREIADFSYRHGGTSLFEFLDVERTVRQTAISFNQVRASYQLALWQLEAAIGKPLN